jgi:predicted DNA-binding protein
MATRAKVGDQPVNVRLPRELHEAVLARATKEDRTMAQTIRVALRYYLQETTPVAEA